jgi:hypothetical protein
MARPPQKEKTPSLRDEIAQSGETEITPEQAAERELADDATFLGREFLSWLVFHAEEEDGTFAAHEELPAFTIHFGNRLTLRASLGQITDVTLKGPSPVGTSDLRYALAGGLQVRQAELGIEVGEDVYVVVVETPYFDLKRVKLPDLELDEEDAELVAEERLQRLRLVNRLLETAFAEFLRLRTNGPRWKKTLEKIRVYLKQ